MERKYANLVEDSLLDRQPMQTLKDGCHVLTSTSIHYEPGSSIESRLHSPDDAIRHTVKDGVTIVDATGNEGMNEGLSGIRWERSANGTKLPELEEAALHDAVHVVLHRQLAIDDDSKVADGVERRDFGALNHEIVLGDLGQPLT
jgi:hypothetical protein